MSSEGTGVDAGLSMQQGQRLIRYCSEKYVLRLGIDCFRIDCDDKTHRTVIEAR